MFAEYSENVKFSNFMLFGVREHSKSFWDKPGDIKYYNIYENYCSYKNKKGLHLAWSFEAFIVKWAGEVAQRHHDIEDAFLPKIIPADDIVEKVKPLAFLLSDDSINRKFERLKEEKDKLNRKDFTTMQYSFAHTLSSFLVDAYVTILIKEFARVLRHFSNTYNIKNKTSFKRAYLNISVKEIRKIMEMKDTKIYKFDKQLGQNLKHTILDSYEIQRMDGKGAYIIRKLVRAYVSNPQQLPSYYINRFIKVEIFRFLSTDSFTKFFTEIKGKLDDTFPENITLWKDYECREVLRIITENKNLLEMSYNPLIRIVFDYIAGMTDSYATIQYKELY